MLVHLYKTPMKSKRWFMRLFAYIIDLCLINAWLFYCRSLNESGMPLKEFRVKVFWSAACKKPNILCPLQASTYSSSSSTSFSTTVDLPLPIQQHCSHRLNLAVRFDTTMFHVTLLVSWQTCNFCRKQGNIVRSNILCRVCKIHLCLNDKRNCFIEYHNVVA